MTDPLGDEPAERALVDALRGGRNDAYETVVRAVTPRLLAVARRIVGSNEDAEDVVQDALIAAFKSIDGFEGHARLSTWLHRIAVNRALMQLRTRRRHPEEPIETFLPTYKDDGHQVHEPVEWSEPIDVAMERAEARALVRAQIDRLPENHRNVLLLRDIEEMSTPETAAVLGITENAVKIRLHRARQAVRALLDPHLRPASLEGEKRAEP